jgi:MFS family permease
MLAFGGIGSLLGPVIGAVAFTILDEWLVEANEYRLIIYGAVILVLFLGFPRGVAPTLHSLTRRRGRAGAGAGDRRLPRLLSTLLSTILQREPRIGGGDGDGHEHR